MTQWTMQTIGRVESCYKEKFAIPRQSGLCPSARARLHLLPPFARAESVRGLAAFSHVWIVFAFHQTAAQGWRPTVRPPKLGGNQRVGVFATRSTFRPNPIGLTVARLLSIDCEDGVSLLLGGADLLDGTPVLDIKPYLAYADAPSDAGSGYADVGKAPLPVRFSDAALATLARHPEPLLQDLICEVLAQDPRPGYKDDGEREYGMRLYDVNVRWMCDAQGALVVRVERESCSG